MIENRTESDIEIESSLLSLKIVHFSLKIVHFKICIEICKHLCCQDNVRIRVFVCVHKSSLSLGLEARPDRVW